jgi:ribosomal protein L16 Arg81 hydroxylase
MRAPSSAELISDYLDTLIADADENIRYQDADLKVPADPNEIDTVAMARVITALNAIRMNDPDKLGDWFGRFITTYRAAGEVMAHQAAPARRKWSRRWPRACCCSVTRGHAWPGAGPSAAPACTSAARTSRCR